MQNVQNQCYTLIQCKAPFYKGKKANYTILTNYISWSLAN